MVQESSQNRIMWDCYRIMSDESKYTVIVDGSGNYTTPVIIIPVGPRTGLTGPSGCTGHAYQCTGHTGPTGIDPYAECLVISYAICSRGCTGATM